MRGRARHSGRSGPCLGRVEVRASSSGGPESLGAQGEPSLLEGFVRGTDRFGTVIPVGRQVRWICLGMTRVTMGVQWRQCEW